MFSDRLLDAEARRLALGRGGSPDDVRAAIAAAERAGELVPRQAVEPGLRSRRDEAVAGWTTPAALATERALLETLRAGRGGVRPVLRGGEQTAERFVAAAEAAGAAAGKPAWTGDQRRAAAGLLASPDRFVAVQGLAGTAKTSTVLAAYAAAARARGLAVVAVAPTNSAARELGAAIGAEGRTLASHLLRAGRREPNEGVGAARRVLDWAADRLGRPAPAREAWVVDEAGLAGARDARALAAAAARLGARVVLVGDERQIGSVAAGRAFGQIQAAAPEAVRTFRLDEIVRQRTEEGRGAVRAALRRDALGALERLEAAGGLVLEEKSSREARWALAAAAWLGGAGAGPDARSSTLLVDPTREGRDGINAVVREALRDEGAVSGPEIRAPSLRPKGVGEAEARRADGYAPGDVVRFGRGHRGAGGEAFARGSHHRVEAVDAAAGTVRLRGEEDGAVREFAPWRLGPGERAVEVLERRADQPLAAGDALRWTATDKRRGIENNAPAEVVSVDPARGSATVRLVSGRELEIDPSRRGDDARWDRGWAVTAHAAQGRTAERAVLHAESWRLNTVHAASFYVLLSRMRDSAVVVTDGAGKLHEAVAGRSGEKQAALEAAPLDPAMREALDRAAAGAAAAHAAGDGFAAGWGERGPGARTARAVAAAAAAEAAPEAGGGPPGASGRGLGRPGEAWPADGGGTGPARRAVADRWDDGEAAGGPSGGGARGAATTAAQHPGDEGEGSGGAAAGGKATAGGSSGGGGGGGGGGAPARPARQAEDDGPDLGM